MTSSSQDLNEILADKKASKQNKTKKYPSPPYPTLALVISVHTTGHGFYFMIKEKQANKIFNSF